MILLAMLAAVCIFCPFTYMVGRVHGINQSVKALDRYSKASELAGGKPLKIDPPKSKKKEPSKNVHFKCGGVWDKWEDCKVNIVNSAGIKTGAVVTGQRRYCTECGEKDIRTDIS